MIVTLGYLEDQLYFNESTKYENTANIEGDVTWSATHSSSAEL